MEVVSGSGRDGGEPSVPVPADGFCGEGEDAWLRRVIAEADADEAWIPGEQVDAALAGPRPAGSPGGFAQGGPADVMAPGPELAALAAAACDPGMLARLTDKNRLPRAQATTAERLQASLTRLAALAEESGTA